MELAKICLLFLILHFNTEFAVSHSTVKFLPGFQGPLPFQLETGYVGVGESEDSQLFYYFVKSERNPEEDPLMLWLTGGPGCSAFSGLFYEIGPINFNIVEYNGSLPTLVLNPNSWTKEASILFVDSPVGTGFSYARTPLASQSGDFTQIQQATQFLRKWLMDHPEFLSNPVYIGGDSYAGLIVPGVVQQISNGNEENIKPLINLQGYILGNPLTDSNVDWNSVIPFAHGMGLISDELYESLKRTCRGQYQIIDPSNEDCLNDIQAYKKCLSGVEYAHVLIPKCPFASPKPQDTYRYLLSHYWVNDKSVQKALNIRERSIGEWIRCNEGINYTKEIRSSVQFHVSLSTKGYRSLIYSGDHDMNIPFLGTQAWIRSLNYSIVDDWRPWILRGQVAGFTRTYSNRMTFATVKGGGHTAPEYRPVECYAMFSRWILHDRL
ncbi:hypothetical protein ACOSQ3_010731 [Xanthoceras sorbifolium]